MVSSANRHMVESRSWRGRLCRWDTDIVRAPSPEGLLTWQARACSSPHRPLPGYEWPESSWPRSGCGPLSRNWQFSSASACDRLYQMPPTSPLPVRQFGGQHSNCSSGHAETPLLVVFHMTSYLWTRAVGVQYVMLSSMVHDVSGHDMFKQFAADAHKVSWALVGCWYLLAFF